MELGLVVDEGLNGGCPTVVVVRPRPSYTPFAPVALGVGEEPSSGAVAVRSSAVCEDLGAGGGGSSSIGESGGGGISVPSVRENVTGVRAGRVNRPLGLLFAGISSFAQRFLYSFYLG
jgi:hypothetical protein